MSFQLILELSLRMSFWTPQNLNSEVSNPKILLFSYWFFMQIGWAGSIGHLWTLSQRCSTLWIMVWRCPETRTWAGNPSSYWAIQNPIKFRGLCFEMRHCWICGSNAPFTCNVCVCVDINVIFNTVLMTFTLTSPCTLYLTLNKVLWLIHTEQMGKSICNVHWTFRSFSSF